MTSLAALRAATIALFATAVVVVTPSVASAQDVICDRGDLEVKALEFRGNHAVSDDELAVSVATTPSSRWRRMGFPWGTRRCLNHADLPRDVRSLISLYRFRGYYGAQVDTLLQPAGKSAVKVTFIIQEGLPILLSSYTVTGLSEIPDSADILGALRLRVGQPFNLNMYRADIDTIVHRLREAGYYRAEALPGYTWDTTTTRKADASISVIPGKRARFGLPQIFSTGVDERGQQIRDDVVRRVMGIVPGDWYSDHAIVDAQRALFQLTAYRHIEVAPLPDSLQPPGDTIVILGARLNEDYMKQLDSEFGWATLDCGRVRLQYTDKNLFGKARRLELTGQASKIGYGYPLETRTTRDLCTLGENTDLRFDRFSDTLHYFVGSTLRQPRLLGTKWVPTISLYSERRGEFQAYLRSTHVGGDVSATRDIADRTPLRLGYTLEYGKTDAPDAALCSLFNRCDPTSRASIKELATLGVASATLARVRTDNLVSPRVGTSMRGEIRTSASRLLGTKESLFFNKGTGDVSWYRPLGSTSVLAARLRGGIVLGRQFQLSASTGFIPPQERLYAGGPTSVRGFQQNELGSLVYIARRSEVDSTLLGVSATNDSTYKFGLKATASGSPDRVVPLGGNSLVVANFEYRIRDPFFFPDLLQYTFFIDGGDAWTRSPTQSGLRLKWTPGIGFRVLSPVGPVQVNVAYNPYPRGDGSLFYNPDVNTLACATPGNGLTYTRGPSTKRGDHNLLVPDTQDPCPTTFAPPKKDRFVRKLTFTFSIGPTF